MKYLFVDLDKSLIKSDYLFESFINYFSKNIFAPIIAIYLLISQGKVGLKKFLHEKSRISEENLPYNKSVITYIKNWKAKYDGRVYLISASDSRFVEKVANHLKVFHGSYGTNKINLRSKNKLEKINSISKGVGFEYIGDSFDDLVIWKDAKKIISVNPSKSLLKKIESLNGVKEEIIERDNFLKKILKPIRLHQWVKNTLLFIPFILAGAFSFNSISTLLLGFIAFSLVASAFYILNDLFDIESDRIHPTKFKRPFAEGSVSIPSGIMIFICLLLGAAVISKNLPYLFQICLSIYAFSTFTYSKYIKKIAVLDIFTLTFLYVFRVISGGVLVEVPVSNWLLTFSVFFFLFLAAVKRWIEIKSFDKSNIQGRGYVSSDQNFVAQLSYFSGLISALIVCLYIDSQQAQNLYSSTPVLWLIPIILLFWIIETLFKVERGKVEDDPVLYALKSKTSYFALVCFGVIIYLATIL